METMTSVSTKKWKLFSLKRGNTFAASVPKCPCEFNPRLLPLKGGNSERPADLSKIRPGFSQFSRKKYRECFENRSEITRCPLLNSYLLENLIMTIGAHYQLSLHIWLKFNISWERKLWNIWSRFPLYIFFLKQHLRMNISNTVMTKVEETFHILYTQMSKLKDDWKQAEKG